MSIADEEGGQEEAPASPEIFRNHHNHRNHNVYDYYHGDYLPLGEGRLSSRGCRTCHRMMMMISDLCDPNVIAIQM